MDGIINIFLMKKVIYIDDEEINIKLFNLNFRKNYSVYTTLFPIEALEIVRKENIHLIITDYKMPVMNGMELIRKVKEIMPNAICMILSAYMESEVVTDKSLIYKYILKPYNKSELADTINEAFKKLNGHGSQAVE